MFCTFSPQLAFHDHRRFNICHLYAKTISCRDIRYVQISIINCKIKIKIAMKETSLKAKRQCVPLITFYSLMVTVKDRSERRVFDSSRSFPKAIRSRSRITLHCGNPVFRFSLLVWKEKILNGLFQLPDLRNKYHFSGKVN